MKQNPISVPRPLVRTNQWFIVICVLLTWLTGVAWLLALPLVAGLMGLVFRFNPVMRFAKRFLKKHPSEYPPEEWEQQQFNQLIAVVWLALGLIGYLVHLTVLAYVFTIMVALAAFIAILGFCIGCFIRYQWTQYRYRKLQRMEQRTR
jgi:hypothetical protein